MRDCPNAEMRDALPDLMHGTLSERRMAEVRAHVDACGACRAELAFLERIRRATVTPDIGAERIVSKLAPYQRRPGWRRVAARPALRVAAAVVLLAGGASLVLRNAPERTVVDSTPPRVAPAELALGETFADVSDSALVALVDAMEDLEATLSDEPEAISVPLTPAGGL